MAHYFRNTAGNWSTVGNWSSTPFSSGYTAVGAIPSATDDVIFEAASANCVVDTGATRVCRALTFTAYTNTIQMDVGITSGGNITLGTSMNITGVGGLTAIAYPLLTITTNGKPWDRPFRYDTGASGGTITITGDFYVSTWTNPGLNVTINGSTVYVTGDCSVAGQQTGTTAFVFTGAGTWSGTGYINGLTINSPGFTRTITGSVGVTGSFVRTAGTISATGSTITFSGTVLSLGGQTINNLTMAAFGALSVPTDLYLTGSFITPNGTNTWSGAGRMYVGGNLTQNGTFSGSVVVEMNGTGTITGTHFFPIVVNTATTTTVGLNCSLSTFTLTAGTLNLANQLGINGGTLTITSGIAFTGSSDLRITASANITSNSIPWPTSVIIANPANAVTTVTINDNLTVNGSFTSASTFATAQNINGGPLNVNQNLTMTNNVQGTSNITLLGSSTTIWSGLGQVGNNLTIDKTGNFTVSGSVCFGNGKTLTYTNVGGVFTVTSSTLFLTNSTLTLGASVWNNLSIRPDSGGGNSGYTVVLSADLYINGTFSTGNFGLALYGQGILNGPGHLYVSGNLFVGQASYNNISGTSKIILAGTGTITGNSYVCINLDITGTYSAVNWVFSLVGTFGQDNKTFRVLGTFTHTGTLTVGNCTLTMGSATLNNLTIAAANSSGIYYTITLTQNTTISGNLIANGTATYGNCTINGLYNLYVGGSLSIGTTYCFLTGTTTIILNGTGTWSGGAGTIGNYQIDVIIDSPTGAITATNIVVGGGKRTLCTSAGTFTATGYYYIQGTSTLNAGSFVWNDLNIGLNSTLTLESSATVRDLVIPSGLGGSVHAINGVGFLVNITRNLTHGNSALLSGTAKLKMNGSGTWSHSSTGAIGIDLEFDSPSGTIVIGTTVIFGNTKTLKYTNVGTLTTTGSTLSIPLGNLFTLDLLNTVWNNLSMAYNSILTLSSASNFNNVTLGTAASGSSLIINGLFNFNVRGNLTNNQTSGGVSGTSTIRFTGTGNWGGSASALNNNVIIDTAGAVTLTSNITWGLATRTFIATSGTLNMGAITLTVVSGTTVTINSAVTLNGGTSTLIVSGTTSTIFDTNGENFFNMTVPVSGNIAITSPLSITGTLALSGNATFTGTSGWTCGTLTCSAPSSIITLQQAITYTTTTNVIMLGTNALRILMRSSDLTAPYVLAKWNLTNTPATQSMVYVSAIAIDSSEGMTIWSFQGGTNGIDASTINWGAGSPQLTKSFTFVC